MRAFIYGVGLQWKLDLREKGILLTYYIVPLVFFVFMGGVFTSVMPDAKETLIQSMTVFGVIMGTIIGYPVSLSEVYGGDIKKAFQVGGIPLWVGVVNNFISGVIHMTIMSIIIFFTAPLIFKATVPQNVSSYFLSLVLFIIACLCIGTLLGLFFKNSPKLTMASQFIFLPSIMVSGIMFPVSMLPTPLMYLSKIFPTTWGFELMTKTDDIALPLIYFSGIIIAAIVVCGIRLKQIATR